MDVSQWQRVKELFSSVLEREPAHRSAFLEEACGGDEMLRQEVESLLAAHEENTPPSGADASTAEATSAEPDSFSGRRIGSYQVVRRIGQGGMATVYLAVRADDVYKKQVAIKIIPAGLDNREVLRRFRNERQTLAALDHPNIVKLLDGGTTEDNLPYLVMDYVEGSPLDDYCDNHSLSTDERLRLFLDVCAAVQYAHQRLVIHRDLKPGNILVTADGTVKLLDFGIAKLLNPEAAATLVVTRTGQRAMTPEYASPEQVRGEPLTNATDVYSLGVVLYELLTGHRLYQLKSFSIAEIEHAICEEEPLTPSTVVTRERQKISFDGTTQTITAAEISRRRREPDASRLRNRLHGDIDAIVMTALRKEPQRRYSSVYEFAEDIRRHLEGLPVKARPSSGTYRLSKFVRRHREATLAFIIAMLLVGCVTIWTMHRSQVGTSSAGQSLGHLGISPRRSIAVLGFKNLSGVSDADWISTALEGMLTTELGAGDKIRTVPGELVAQARASLPTNYGDTLSGPTLAKMRVSLGTDLVVLGSYVALPAGKIRLDLRVQDALSGETIAETAEVGTITDLFDLVSRTGGVLRGKLGIGFIAPTDAASVRASLPSNPEAVRLYAEGLAKLRVFESLAARDLLQRAVAADPQFSLAHSALADAWTKLGYDARKKAEAKRAFDLSTNLRREDQLWIEGRYREAISEWERAIEVYRTLFTFAPDNIEYGLQLAAAQRIGGKPGEALNTIALLRKFPPPSGGDARIDLAEADAAGASGDFKRERQAALRALDKANLQGAKLLMAQAFGDETWACENLGDLDCAGSSAERARGIYATVGDQNGVASMLESMGRVLSKRGQPTVALQSYEQALRIDREIGSQHGIASLLNNMAILVAGQGRLTEAKAMWEKALAAYREVDDRDDQASVLLNIAQILVDLGDLSAANEKYHEALIVYSEVGDQSGIAYTLENNSRVLLQQGNLAEADKMAKSALEMYQGGGDKRSVASALVVLGDISQMKGELERAFKQYSEALTIQNQMKDELRALGSRLALGRLSIEQGHATTEEGTIREIRDELHRQNQVDDEILAGTVLVEDLLKQGKIQEGLHEIDAIKPLAVSSQNREMRLNFTLTASHVLAATNMMSEARRSLETLLAEATRYGFVAYQFEARLSLGNLEIQSGRVSDGQARLQALEKEANSKMFRLIARKAANATNKT